MAQLYRERLSVPWWWWLLGMGLALTFVIAVWAFLGNGWGLGALIAAALLVAAFLIAWSRTVITVDEAALTVGRARIEHHYVGEVAALDRTQSTLALRDAPRDWLLLRPWLHELVSVGVDDPADTHPRWLVSSAHPDDLSAALHQARATQEAR